MTHPSPCAPLPHHRLARLSPRYRWWRPLVGTLVFVVLYVAATGLLDAVTSALGTRRGYPKNPDGSVDFGPVSGTALDLLFIAVAIPVVLLVVRWIGRRPAGSVSSVTGRLRWRWLALCLLTAAPVFALMSGAGFLLPDGADQGDRWAGWAVFGPALAMLVVLVPLQTAAEEYVFRGWLTQTFGAYLRSPWCAFLPQAVLFAAAHGWGTPWGFADLVVFGAAGGWLTWRTGGLEASVALHAVTNLFAFGISAAVVGGLDTDDTAADAAWQLVALDVVSIALYTAAVAWLLRRRTLDRTAPAPPQPTPAVPPSGYGLLPGAPVPPPWPEQGAPFPPGRPGGSGRG
ncbi:lysostaphin resistance A-like protein [Streptomyces sp. NPDC052301]|uniref:lysostaphin resistance A-like protein n=1 Tax=Streptomyces sp. NPDC052301 TaxID=3365687 RepID=UPI0037D87FF8